MAIGSVYIAAQDILTPAGLLLSAVNDTICTSLHTIHVLTCMACACIHVHFTALPYFCLLLSYWKLAVKLHRLGDFLCVEGHVYSSTL